jgi:hypothetical protein
MSEKVDARFSKGRERKLGWIIQHFRQDMKTKGGKMSVSDEKLIYIPRSPLYDDDLAYEVDVTLRFPSYIEKILSNLPSLVTASPGVMDNESTQPVYFSFLPENFARSFGFMQADIKSGVAHFSVRPGLDLKKTKGLCIPDMGSVLKLYEALILWGKNHGKPIPSFHGAGWYEFKKRTEYFGSTMNSGDNSVIGYILDDSLLK